MLESQKTLSVVQQCARCQAAGAHVHSAVQHTTTTFEPHLMLALRSRSLAAVTSWRPGWQSWGSLGWRHCGSGSADQQGQQEALRKWNASPERSAACRSYATVMEMPHLPLPTAVSECHAAITPNMPGKTALRLSLSKLILKIWGVSGNGEHADSLCELCLEQCGKDTNGLAGIVGPCLIARS